MNHSISMIPGARESWESLLYNESKNIENRRELFDGDHFEKIFVLSIDENTLILLSFCDTISTKQNLVKKYITI